MKMTEEEVLYCREHYVPGDSEFGLGALAEKFGVSRDNVKDCVHGRTYKKIGGKIHIPREHVHADLKAKILRDDGSIESLAEKYHLKPETIARIVRKPLRKTITDELRRAIRAEYVPYSSTSNRNALAEKYGVSAAAVGVILRDGFTRQPKPAPLIDALKEAIVVAHDEENLSVKALAERFNLNRQQVRDVLTEAGVEIRKRQPIPNDVKEKVRQLYASGQYSVRELAERFDINRASLTKILSDIKPPKPQPTLPDQNTIERVLNFHARGHGVSPIAKSLGLPIQIVRKIVNGEL